MGQHRLTLTEGVRQAQEVLEGLQRAGISLDHVTDGLLAKGVATFGASFDKLLAALEEKRREMMSPPTGATGAR